MRIVVLIDNIADNDCQLASEHGLSIYIESAGKRILLDTGLSGSFIDNARSLSIDLNGLDFCFLSHGHNDHCGGLAKFLETVPSTKVYLAESIYHEQYFSSRHATKHDLSISENIFQQYAERFIPLNKSQWIAPNIAAVYCNHHEYASPQGNVFLTKKVNGMEMQDDFCHEMALVFMSNEGLIIFSSCSHNGAVNIMKSCEDFTGVHIVKYFIGGLHFVDCNQTEHEVTDFINTIHSEYPHTTFITGHCTSDKAKEYLKTSDLDITFFHTGSELTI